MRKIKLGKRARNYTGYSALVDNKDFLELYQYAWHVILMPSTGLFHASRNIAPPGGVGPGGSIKMHNQILGRRSGMVVQHVNGDTLDNRRANLRFVQRCAHLRGRKRGTAPRTKSKKHTSAYLGVCRVSFRHSGKPWRAYIYINGRQKHLGTFADEEVAALAYDAAAFELYEGDATFNFI